MEVWVNLKFGNGDFQQGFSKIILQIDAIYNQINTTQLETQLPPAQEIPDSYERWKKSYDLLARSSSRGFKNNQVTNLSPDACFQYSTLLQAKLNQWLLPIKLQLESVISSNKNADIRLVVNTHGVTSEPTKNILHRIPWHECNLFTEHSSLEAALCFKDSLLSQIRGATKPNSDFRRIKIISIFGDSRNIDTSTDEKLIIDLEKRGAETLFWKEPKRETLHELWDKPCDILFFAGHSDSPEHGQKGIINLNENESLDLEEIPRTLKSAINKGLKLAIFNSCDGLGLAKRLADLNLPYVIVWREPVPDKIAHKFLKFFLSSYAGGDSLFTAVYKARGKLLELTALSDSQKLLRGVSWLPIICKNTLELPPSWSDLGGLSGKLPECPYQGLSAFGEEEADFFKGREKYVDELVAAVQSKSLVSVVGVSGSGKSSVVFAGLVPRLRKLGNVEIISFRPGNNPLGNLAIALNNSLNDHFHTSSQIQRPSDQMVLEVDLRHDETKLSRIINDIITKRHLVLIADQFEELYTLAPQEESQPFLDALIYAINHAPRFTLVLTLRADFYEYALSYRPFSDALQKGIYNLGPMNREELRCAVEKPAQKMKVVLEKGLSDTLIKDLGNEAGRLPLLEFTLTQLWDKPRRWFLTHEAYQEIGGVEKALANYADTVLDKLSHDDIKRAEKIFIQLVRPGEGMKDTRRVATRREVGEKNWDLAQQLADVRLLVTGCDHSSENKEETVEIIHEALIREWGTFSQWIQNNREFRTWQERLRGAMQQWQETGQDEGALLRGTPLAEAEDWLQVLPSDVSKSEQVFIQLSLELRDREQKQHQRVQEDQIKSISRYSELLLKSNREFDALIEAIRVVRQLTKLTVSPETRQQFLARLREAIYKVRERNRLEGHEHWVNSVSFSPDGQTIATASDDKTIKLWSRNGRLVRTIQAHEARVTRVVFSPDGQKIASVSSDSTVKLWSKTGQLLHDFKAHEENIWGVNFSPDGQTIATASDDKTVKLWSLNGKLLRTLDKHRGWVRSVNFSPDGQKITTASRDGTVKLWSLDGELLHDFKADVETGEGWIDSVSFSPDGKLLVSAHRDKTIKIWKINDKTLKTVKTIPAHDEWVRSATFSPDGKTIASVSADRTIKLWSLDGQLLQTINGHDDWVNSVSFAPSSSFPNSPVSGVSPQRFGQLLASASHDKTVKLWNFDIQLLPTLKGHTEDVNSVAFSPDDQTIATASDDNTVRLWNRSGKLLQTLRGHSDKVRQVVFSPVSVVTPQESGQIIATASEDESVKLWKLDGELLSTFTRHNGSVNSVAFSPDGKNLLTASHDKTVKLWSLDGRELQNFTEHEGTGNEETAHKEEVFSAIFSPDGSIIATASRDYSVKLWSIDGQLLHTLNGHNSWVRKIDFSPDGKIIASASDDKTIKLWNRDGELLRTLTGHNNEIRSVRFSPDGQTIVSSGEDKTVKLWSIDGDELQTLTTSEGSVNSATFSRDGQIIAYGGEDKLVVLRKVDLNKWVKLSNSDLEELLVLGCNWVRDYLKNNKNVSKSDRTLCNGIGTQK